MTYPLGLNLSGRRVLVVGGGPVAARRVPPLLAEGAAVELVAPRVEPGLAELAESGALVWHRRGFLPEDVTGAWLVLAHTDSAEVQGLVHRTAEEQRVFCVAGGDAAGSSAWVPGVARAHGVTVAVNAGADPRRAKAVTAWLAARLETGEIPVAPQRPGVPGAESVQAPGTVALVGGGPGDPGLLTVRG
ncbi:uroporphyrinogen-III C-methyltransferase, partial [Kocuria tytonicola]|uniref:precorrin-2 dehydrogenase/sirohydrochlorin ferrochelatase family protein n=1 Tax=Kocuria tytonicola TaxID=2055946 RepID=UPI000F0E0435